MRKLFVSLIIIIGALLIPSTTHARTELRCKRFLFFEFSCAEVQVDYLLAKRIRMSGENEFREKLDSVLDTQEMVFRIEIKNSGEATDNNLKIIDILPQNLTFVSSENMVVVEDRKVKAEIDGEIQPNKIETFTYVAQANVGGVGEGEKRCVTNNATLYRDENNDSEAQDEEIEASDNNTICILNGAPGTPEPTKDQETPAQNDTGNFGSGTPDQLPNSAAGGLTTILASIATLGSGAILTKKIRF